MDKVGLGDAIADVLHSGRIGRAIHNATGHKKPCGGCKNRQQRLNNYSINKSLLSMMRINGDK